MTSIENVQAIVTVIRRQLSQRPGKSAADEAVRSQRARSGESPPDLLTLVGQRVKALDRNDPDRGRKVFRVFLESVLLSELDEALINDPAFYRVVDDVQRQMESDPEVAASIAAAIEHLTADAT